MAIDLTTRAGKGAPLTNAEMDTNLAEIETAVNANETAIAGKAAATHVHAADDVTSGVFAPARLGSGSPSGANFLRGDGTWAAPAGGGGGSGLTIPGMNKTIQTLNKGLPSANGAISGTGLGLPVDREMFCAFLWPFPGKTVDMASIYVNTLQAGALMKLDLYEWGTDTPWGGARIAGFGTPTIDMSATGWRSSAVVSSPPTLANSWYILRMIVNVAGVNVQQHKDWFLLPFGLDSSTGWGAAVLQLGTAYATASPANTPTVTGSYYFGSYQPAVYLRPGN